MIKNAQYDAAACRVISALKLCKLNNLVRIRRGKAKIAQTLVKGGHDACHASRQYIVEDQDLWTRQLVPF